MKDIKSSDIIISRTIFHYLVESKNRKNRIGEENVISKVMPEINNKEILELLKNYIVKSVNDQKSRVAIFNSTNSNIATAIENLSGSDEEFISNSGKVAKILENIMYSDSRIKEATIAVIEYKINNQNHYAILKLDLLQSYIPESDIDKLGNKYITISLDKHNALPSKKHKLQKCAFIHANFSEIDTSDNGHHMIILDKQSGEDDIAKFFIEDFLDASFVRDSKFMTRNFIQLARNFTKKKLNGEEKKNFYKSIETQVNQESVSIKDFAENFFGKESETGKLFIAECRSKLGDLEFRTDSKIVKEKYEKIKIKIGGGSSLILTKEMRNDSSKFKKEPIDDVNSDYEWKITIYVNDDDYEE